MTKLYFIVKFAAIYSYCIFYRNRTIDSYVTTAEAFSSTQI